MCELTTYMPYGGGRSNKDASKLLNKLNVNNNLFLRQDRDF